MRNLQINATRLWESLMDTARFGATLKGGIVEDIPRALAQLHLSREKGYSLMARQRDLLRASSDVRHSMNQVAIRGTLTASKALRRKLAVDFQLAAKNSDPTAMARVIDRLNNEMVDEAATSATRVGDSVPGVRWVDKRLARELPTGETNAVFRALRQGTRPFRFNVYGRPSYILNNYPQNLGMLAFHHGARAPRLLAKALKLPGSIISIGD